MSKRTRFHATVDETTLHTIYRICDEMGSIPVGRAVDFLVVHYRKTKYTEPNQLAELVAEAVVQKLKKK